MMSILTEMRQPRLRPMPRMGKKAVSADNLFVRYRLFWLLAALSLFFYTLSTLQTVLTPFITAAIIAYILLPFVKMLSKYMSHNLAVMTVMFILLLSFLLLLLIIAPLFSTQIDSILIKLPQLILWIEHSALPWWQQHFGHLINLQQQDFSRTLTEHSTQLQSSIKNLIPALQAGLKTGTQTLLLLLANILLVPVLLFYFLRDAAQFTYKIDLLTPRRWHTNLSNWIRQVDHILGEFLRGQLTVILLLSVFYTLGLWIAGVESALAIGLLTGLLGFIPYVGFSTGLVLALISAFLQNNHFYPLIGVGIVYAVGQFLESFVITPKLVGERIGLHPTIVIFALMAFGQLLGFVGVLLALPLAAVCFVTLKILKQRYLNSAFYQGQTRIK